ncbi:hypothetical protein HYV44_00805 [Candidatus Microgenomates bacterium]|nr:hypothetical protein [Candidatus Microgenomates bacterium]
MELYNALVTLIKDYMVMVEMAVKQGRGILYIGASPNLDEELFRQIEQYPETILRSGDNSAGEPSYLSLEDGNRGRNTDGSPHGGFLVLNVLERKVVDLINNDGSTRLTRKNSQHFSGHYKTGTTDQNHVATLREAMGWFVIMEDGNRWPWSNGCCRCPQIDFEAFLQREYAEKKMAELFSSKKKLRVEVITEDFIRWFMDFQPPAPASR